MGSHTELTANELLQFIGGVTDSTPTPAEEPAKQVCRGPHRLVTVSIHLPSQHSLRNFVNRNTMGRSVKGLSIA